MDPFEEGMVSAKALHAVSARKEAGGARTVDGTKYEMYYNPMWGLLGDRNNTTAGTFRRRNGVYCFIWNMLDQVIMRPSLTGSFVENSLRILDSDG